MPLQQKLTPDPLAVTRGLAEAADPGAWFTTVELAALLGVAVGTLRSWESGHCPRPGFELERRKESASVWWRVIRQRCLGRSQRLHAGGVYRFF